MADRSQASSDANTSSLSRPTPPNIQIPKTPLLNDETGPTSPKSPTGVRTRPLPSPIVSSQSHGHAQPVSLPETGSNRSLRAETEEAKEVVQRSLPMPQRALSPPPARPLPATPGALPSTSASNRQPFEVDASNAQISDLKSKTPLVPLVTGVTMYSPRMEHDHVVKSRLGTAPARDAPVPNHQSEERDSTPPLPSSPLMQRSATASATRTLDLSGVEGGKAGTKAASSSSLFGLLSRPSKGSFSTSTAGPESPAPHGDNDRLRVHFKPLAEVPEGHFAPQAPTFNATSHRDRVGFEVYTSELSYNNFMRILLEVYKLPLMSAQKAGHVQIKEEDAQKVFGPIESVLAVSDIVLAALLERIEKWDPETQLLGDVFVKYGDLLKVYATYAREQQQAKIAQSHCSSSKSYNAMLKMSQQYPACQSRDLSSLLIMPIQRIPRYELLLRDFIKATPATHPDLPLLNQALAKVKSVAEQVDRAVEEYKQLEKLLAIQSSFSGSNIDLVKPGRRFIREGTLIKVCRRANKIRKFWLFNDILLYGIPILTGTNVVSAELPLKHLQLQDLPDLQSEDNLDAPSSPSMGASSPHASVNYSQTGSTSGGRPLSVMPNTNKPVFQFMIQSRAKSFVVIATSITEKADWMVDIMNAVKAYQEASKSLQTSGNGKGNTSNHVIDVAPAWVPDAMAPQCKICSNEFGLVTRRHHCRHCGLVVCGDCSKGRIVLPGLDKLPVRVCDNCINKLGYGSYDASRGQSNPRATEAPQSPTINLLANLTPPPGTTTSPTPVTDSTPS